VLPLKILVICTLSTFWNLYCIVRTSFGGVMFYDKTEPETQNFWWTYKVISGIQLVIGAIIVYCLAHPQRFSHTAGLYESCFGGYLNHSVVAYCFEYRGLESAKARMCTGSGLKRRCKKPKRARSGKMSPYALLPLCFVCCIQRCRGDWQWQEWRVAFKVMHQ
jgi:hypothetical protein